MIVLGLGPDWTQELGSRQCLLDELVKSPFLGPRASA